MRLRKELKTANIGADDNGRLYLHDCCVTTSGRLRDVSFDPDLGELL